MRYLVPALALLATAAVAQNTAPPVSNPQPGTDRTQSPETTTDDRMEQVPATTPAPGPNPTATPDPASSPSPSPSPSQTPTS